VLSKKTKIIAIAGASASGKSLFAQTICEEIQQEFGEECISILKEDSYYRSQDKVSLSNREKINYDHPDAIEYSLFEAHLQELIAGRNINAPVYSFKTHTRTKHTAVVRHSKVIIVEGILLLSNKRLNELFDIKIFMDTPLDVCLLRRIRRDTLERGRDVGSILQQYLETVRPMYYEFIDPSKMHADIMVNHGGKNRNAVDIIKAKIGQIIS